MLPEVAMPIPMPPTTPAPMNKPRIPAVLANVRPRPAAATSVIPTRCAAAGVKRPAMKPPRKPGAI